MKTENKIKIYSRKCNYAVTFSGKTTLNFFINLTLYFFINFILTFTNGKEVKHVDLRKAVDVMLKKHPTCRWRSEKVRSRKYFILVEGYY